VYKRQDQTRLKKMHILTWNRKGRVAMKPTETPSHMLQGYPAQSNQQSVYTKKIKKTGCGCGKKKKPQ
ncbi:hypothetical protein, partial [Bacillus cereus]